MNDKTAIKAQIDDASIVSFDIFDTLITRRTHKPTDVFYFVQEAINDSGENLYIQFDFPRERIRAERLERELWSASGRNPDLVTLEAIYNHLAELTFLSDKIADRIKKWEVSVEQECIELDKDCLELYRYAVAQKKTVLLLSDMYLPKSTIERFLKELGISGYQRLIVSSSDLVCKSDGSMFSQLIDEGLDQKSWVHIGDNRHSDVLVPSNLGICACEWQNSDRLLGYKPVFRKTSVFPEMGMIERAGVLSTVSAQSLDNHIDNLDNFWWRLGSEVGGHIQVGFVEWLIGRARMDGVDKLLFLARDGQIVSKVYEVASKHHTGIPSSEYCWASRRLFNMAAIEKLQNGDIDFLLSGTTTLKAYQYLERIGIVSKKALKAVRQVGLREEDVVNSPESMQKLHSLMWLLAGEIEARAAAERAVVADYLRSLGIEKKTVGVVDIGWHGSMQAALQKILKLEKIPCEVRGYYFGLHKLAKTRQQPMNAFINEFDDGLLYQLAVMHGVEIVELLFSALHPTVVGLKRSDEGFKAQFGHRFSQEGFDSAALQGGIIDFAKEFYSLYKREPRIIPTPEATLQTLIRLINNPTLKEAKIIGSVNHYEGFGSNKKLVGRPIVCTPKTTHYLFRRKEWRKERDRSFWTIGFDVRARAMIAVRLRHKLKRYIKTSIRLTRHILKRIFRT